MNVAIIAKKETVIKSIKACKERLSSSGSLWRDYDTEDKLLKMLEKHYQK